MGDNTTAAFVLALIGGIFVLLNGIVVAALAGMVGSAVTAAGQLGGELGLQAGAASIIGGGLLVAGIAAVIIGLLVIVGSIMIRNPAKQKTWGIITLILSIISLLFGGGFIIGFVLGLIGGILAITNKKQ